MKKLLYGITILGLLSLYNCNKKSEEKPEKEPVANDTIQTAKKDVYSDKVFETWIAYYKGLDPNFQSKLFEKEAPYKIIREKATSPAVWDAKFNSVYKDFLIYNADSTQYIDIDSYKWKMLAGDQLQIGPDQEILLVNIPNKKVERILFYGPSFWVENAYFKNDSTIVLLENSSDKKPGYQEINLNTDSAQYYIYPKALKEPSEYLKKRILSTYKKDF